MSPSRTTPSPAKRITKRLILRKAVRPAMRGCSRGSPRPIMMATPSRITDVRLVGKTGDKGHFVDVTIGGEVVRATTS